MVKRREIIGSASVSHCCHKFQVAEPFIIFVEIRIDCFGLYYVLVATN